MKSFQPTLSDLLRAVAIKERIASLESELANLLGVATAVETIATKPTKRRRKRKPMSAEARAKISAAQKKRWSVSKGKKASAKPAKATPSK